MAGHGTRSFVPCSRATLWLCIAGYLLLACKNPFATREPEEPVTERTRWVPPTDPRQAVENLRVSLIDRRPLDYMRCLSDSSLTGKAFHFDAEPAVLSNYGDLFRRWDLTQERRYLDQLYQSVPDDSTISVQFEFLGEQVGDAGDRLLIMNYVLEVHHVQRSSLPVKFEGRAEFWLIQDESTSYWYIWKWSDRATRDTATWSLLKAYFGG